MVCYVYKSGAALIYAIVVGKRGQRMKWPPTARVA